MKKHLLPALLFLFISNMSFAENYIADEISGTICETKYEKETLKEAKYFELKSDNTTARISIYNTPYFDSSSSTSQSSEDSCSSVEHVEEVLLEIHHKDKDEIKRFHFVARFDTERSNSDQLIYVNNLHNTDGCIATVEITVKKDSGTNKIKEIIFNKQNCSQSDDKSFESTVVFSTFTSSETPTLVK